MSLLFKISKKEFLSVRNKIFLERGCVELESKGFTKSPFENSWFGINNMGDYTYEMGRLSKDSRLELIVTHITRDDRWIKIFLNIFELSPKIEVIDEIKGADPLNFYMMPNSIKKLRLRSDEYKGLPLFNIMFCPKYKLGKSYCKRAFNRKVNKLSKLIGNDMRNIDKFINRWHEMNQPNLVFWKEKM